VDRHRAWVKAQLGQERLRGRQQDDCCEPSISADLSQRDQFSEQSEVQINRAGPAEHRVHFGAVSGLLEQLIDRLPIDRAWIVFDEWSHVPMELQPLLADLVRRTLLPVRGVVVKLGVIEQRSLLRVDLTGGGYLGIEVGADAAADIDLDDFMVFGNDADKAKDFFRELLHKHVRSLMVEDGHGKEAPSTSNALISRAFTQQNAFAEYVRAAEGVPRDAINIAIQAAQLADDRQISVNDVRAAARRWYTRDKESAVAANDEARRLLHWIIDTVIGERRARAFLLEQGEAKSHPLIGSLYDARVLHVAKRGVATHDQPGVRFDVYQLDFGCYVELLTTVRAPEGLFEVENEAGDTKYVDVPTEDYRSIRRAILDLDEFDRTASPS
jgi:hypothetical protein